MNIGIIGAGYMGSLHAHIIKGLPCGNLRGITARTADNSKRISEELDIRHYADHEELLADELIDVVDICTPTATHARIARESMEAGKHVIIEFPACCDKNEMKDLRRASRKTGKVCAVAYYSRFQSQYKYFFELAKSGKIGKMHGLSISRRSSCVFSSDDIVNNLVSQDIDCMVSLLGRPKSFVCLNEKQDMCVILFKYDGMVVTIEGVTNMHKDFPFSTRHVASGENGSLDLEWMFMDFPQYQMKCTTEKGVESLKSEDYDPYRFELEQILSGIANGSTAGFDIDSVYESAMLSFECRSRMK